ncbi:tRNA glutamyl-Q(34) synthetase GluQRS [Ahrensia marina]|uniref:Glutamyl-Q tRNA(Asp) ligase n=1 Tax=Ahrensia marina TaxID=1514904 RepID=A0A0M9GKY5_9HYPH|nr:tRNA glutamyl-Q(34) synthetase GluQRS [Ahrensia marina]KPB00227.1 glutamyl-Q tRNA(Asp) ligase [Ahrensia marina]
MALKTSPPVFRFAPSPNGLLHLGHAYSALLNFDTAKALGGRFLLRIEDTDLTRARPEFEQAIFDDLQWLGIKWEEPVRRQSDHFADYQSAMGKLEAEGIVYRSYLTRSDIKRIVEAYEAKGCLWPRDPDGAPHFPGRQHEEQNAHDGDSYTVRLDIDAALRKVGRNLFWQEASDNHFSKVTNVMAEPAKWSDIILVRRDAPASYNLAVVIDDAIQGVTHIVRGKDIYEATSVQRLLQELLGLPQPAYYHHSLICDDNGRKLSKSRDDTSLASLRAGGATPDDIRALVGLTGG